MKRGRGGFGGNGRGAGGAAGDRFHKVRGELQLQHWIILDWGVRMEKKENKSFFFVE